MAQAAGAIAAGAGAALNAKRNGGGLAGSPVGGGGLAGAPVGLFDKGATQTEPRYEIGSGMDFYARQKSPIYDGRGNVTGFDHGYGNVETFDKPIPRDQYTGPGPSMGESQLKSDVSMLDGGNIFKDNFPIGWCPTPDMQILLSDKSQKPAGELQVGDEVRTAHEKDFTIGNYKVTRVELIDSPIVKLNFDGKSITCSPTHKFYSETDDDWTSAENLKEGDRVALEDGEITFIDRQQQSDGKVVSITVDEAHTYICEGFLCHNKTLSPESHPDHPDYDPTDPRNIARNGPVGVAAPEVDPNRDTSNDRDMGSIPMPGSVPGSRRDKINTYIENTPMSRPVGGPYNNNPNSRNFAQGYAASFALPPSMGGYRKKDMVDLELGREGRISPFVAVGQSKQSPDLGWVNDDARGVWGGERVPYRPGGAGGINLSFNPNFNPSNVNTFNPQNTNTATSNPVLQTAGGDMNRSSAFGGGPFDSGRDTVQTGTEGTTTTGASTTTTGDDNTTVTGDDNVTTTTDVTGNDNTTVTGDDNTTTTTTPTRFSDDFATEQDARNYINQYYNTHLGRDANFDTAGGAQYWIDNLRSGADTKSSFDSNVLLSDEYTGRESFKDLAKSMEGKDFNATGTTGAGQGIINEDSLDAWIGPGGALTQSTDSSKPGYYQGTGTQAEYETATGTTLDDTDSQIYQLYKDVFGRNPDQAGLDYWIDRADDGMSLDKIEASFKGSAEAKGRANLGGTNNYQSIQSYLDNQNTGGGGGSSNSGGGGGGGSATITQTGGGSSNTGGGNNNNTITTTSQTADDWLQDFYTEAGLGTVDQGGRDYWMGDLNDRGQTKEQIRANIMRHAK